MPAGFVIENLKIGSPEGSCAFAWGPLLIYTTTTISGVPDWFPPESSIGLDSAQTGVKFWYPTKATATDSVQMPSQTFPVAARDELTQIKHKMGSGKWSIYNRTNSDRIYPVNLRNVSTTKRQRLYKFFRNITIGALNTFEFEDEGANLYTMRLMTPVINIPMEHWLKHIAMIEMWKEVT